MTKDLYPVRLTVLRFYLDVPFQGNGGDLRRAMTAALPDISLLHHHDKAGKSDYSIAQIRYLLLEGIPHIVSFGEGRRIINEIALLKQLVVGNTGYQICGYDFIEDGATVGVCDQLMTYRSRSPWLALNQANNGKFRSLDDAGRKALLNSILIGNCLSILKGLHLRIKARVFSKILDYRIIPAGAHIPMTGIEVHFVSNFLLPDFLGIGKMPSKGFGLMDSQ